MSLKSFLFVCVLRLVGTYGLSPQTGSSRLPYTFLACRCFACLVPFGFAARVKGCAIAITIGI